jgi:hypothetical protein
MTVQEHLDALAERILMEAIDGTMPLVIKQEVQPLLDRLQTEMDIYGHVQTKIPAEVLAMPWERFSEKIELLEQMMREH